MFYSEACQLIGNVKNYTYEIAHDQVQAIRLMCYCSQESQELRELINHHQTFDDAYTFLQKLTKQRTNTVSH